MLKFCGLAKGVGPKICGPTGGWLLDRPVVRQGRGGGYHILKLILHSIPLLKPKWEAWSSMLPAPQNHSRAELCLAAGTPQPL
jgi:hypothetical protein